MVVLLVSTDYFISIFITASLNGFCCFFTKSNESTDAILKNAFVLEQQKIHATRFFHLIFKEKLKINGEYIIF